MLLSRMGIESYPDQLEPENQEAAIWRFINMRKFRDLMETAELYFCREARWASSLMTTRFCAEAISSNTSRT